jgi:tRNA/rRNA methyltransferase
MSHRQTGDRRGGPDAVLQWLLMLTAAERDRVCVVLVGSRNPLNIGAAARAMANFGFGRVRLVRPYEPSFREARSAVGAAAVLAAAEEFAGVAEAVADCTLVAGTTGGEQRNATEPLERLEAGAERIRAHLRAGARVAILFGSEKVGLSNEELSHCQALVRIPTEPEQPSMNLGQAVAVALYELIRDSGAETVNSASAPLATAADRERLVEVLTAALEASGAGHVADEARLRRLVQHMALTAEDAHAWLGLFRQMLWKLKNGG